ncbi:glycosyltransferase family 4 protein [Nocardioides sp.]|uniref:glycosyltransferase family 4 protein n=1 Tax=Nocardioides sp. TaxID=35761 RepID=UPI002716081A|nr:glycosyltransferase family 4 protein [Nocardioides sp.]MDO9454928.1 glycosyltransferase family 4 protein [Nocardioides sp.]
MRALFINENIGGHATVHAHLRNALVGMDDIDVDIVDVPAPTGGRRFVGAAVPGLGRLDADLQPLRAQLSLSGWVRRELRTRLAPGHGYDVLHVYTGNAALRSAGLLASLPSVVSTDATNATNNYRLPYRQATRFTPRAVRAAQRFERPVYEAASIVIANTGWVASSLRDAYGLGDDKLRVFPFGITRPPGIGSGPAPGTVAPEGLPQLVFVGRQLERKGALRLLRLHQQHLADECELVLVTPENPPPGRNVRVVSDVTVGSGRLWEVLRAAAVFVFPSVIDQAPNAVIEAQAAGLPVVVLDLGAMPEMVPTTVGRVVPPDDDEALVATLRDLVRHPEVRAELGAAGRERFESVYDARVSTRRLVETLGEARELFARREGTSR